MSNKRGLGFVVDFGDLEKHLKELEKLGAKEVLQQMEDFHVQTIKELAARLSAEVIARTPVGDYGSKEVHFVTRDGQEVTFIANPNKTGGTLRRGWEVGDIVKKGNVYEVEILNMVYYAPYVEYGHRTRERIDGSRGWVKGRFMLAISEQELREKAPDLIEAKLEKFLKGLITGDS